MAYRIRVHEIGGPSVLRHERYDVGEPGAGQVRLRQDAAGVNFVDTQFRDGTFSRPLPFTAGIEGAGVVEAVGPGAPDLKVGDRVAYWFSFGGYADRRIVDAEALVSLPSGVSTEEAAALFTKGLSAWVLVRSLHAVKPGETVLVHAAAGGVGSLAASWAQALGARVIATVGSPGKVSAVRDRGVDDVLGAGDPDLADKVRALSGGIGADVVYELVGAATFGASVAALRDGGDLVHFGNASGFPVVDHAALTERSIRYVAATTGDVVNGRAALDEASRELWAALRTGVFGRLSVNRYRLREARRAHEGIRARAVSGLTILTP